MTNIKFPLTISIHKSRDKVSENQGHDHQTEIAMIFNKFSQLVLYEKVWIPVRRFCILTRGLKGLKEGGEPSALNQQDGGLNKWTNIQHTNSACTTADYQ